MITSDDPSGRTGPGAGAPGLDLTPVRVTELLQEAGHRVVVEDLDAEPVGTGQMGASYRLRLTVTEGRELVPETLVAKVAAGPADKRAIAAGSYRTEVDFYRKVADTVSVRVPHCWASWMSGDATDFVLLLEDLAPRKQGDQLVGCTPAQATAAAVNLAGLHGPRWCDPNLAEEGGLNRMDDDAAGLLADVMGPMVELFVQRFADRLAPADRTLLEAVPAVAGPWLVGRGERFGPVHGDYRLDNLLFSDDGTDVVAVDWQTVSLGLPARDLAFLCSTGLDPAARRSCEGDVVRAYHAALLEHGVTGYPVEQALDDYAYAMLQGPLIVVFGWAVAEPTDRGDEMFLAMTERSCAAIRHHDTFARL